MVDLDTLDALAREGNIADRAFVDGVVRLSWSRTPDPARRSVLAGLLERVRVSARRAHRELGRKIATGELRGAALRECFEAAPLLERDPFVEEVLGIAYPPLDEPELGRELVPYLPSGYDEIVHGFDVSGLSAGDRFVDLGSGTGKAVLLAALLCGATSSGIELDPALHERAEAAAITLGLSQVTLARGDVRASAWPPADVVFMYIPFTGSVLAEVLRRLVREGGPRHLCASAIDAQAFPELVPVGRARSWLHVYAVAGGAEWRGGPVAAYE